jgi:hypothetical protein
MAGVPVEAGRAPLLARPLVHTRGAGNAVIASLTYDEDVQLQTLSAASVLGPLVTIPRPDLGYGPIAIAVAPSGNAVVAWDNSRRADRRMLARTASAAGRLGPVLTLWQGHHPRRAQSPVAGVSDAGDAVVAWRIESRYHNVRSRVQSRTVGIDGTLGPILDLTGSGREGAHGVLVAPGGGTMTLTASALRLAAVFVAPAPPAAVGAVPATAWAASWDVRDGHGQILAAAGAWAVSALRDRSARRPPQACARRCRRPRRPAACAST